MAKTKNGYLLIADITGYTAYLNESELEHAHEVLQSLLSLLIEHTRPPLIISRLAGDAVISYGLRDKFLSGQTFIEMIEDTYVSFRKMINLMVLNNTCRCNACANISNLDLKFFVHYGLFTLQKLDHHDELLGSDVILIHRLLKNHVIEKTGYHAYALYTDAVIQQLGLDEISPAMIPHTEKYEHLGEVQTWVQDMHPIWEMKKDLTRIEIPPGKYLAQEHAEYPIPVQKMWDIVTDPEYRALFMNTLSQKIRNRQNGRLAPGSVYECFHGNSHVTLQTILEWQPFEQITTEDTTPVPGATCLINIRLTPTKSGTRFVITCGRARGKYINRLACNLVGRVIVPKQFREGIREFSKRLEKDISAGLFSSPTQNKIELEEISAAALSSLSPPGNEG